MHRNKKRPKVARKSLKKGFDRTQKRQEADLSRAELEANRRVFSGNGSLEDCEIVARTIQRLGLTPAAKGKDVGELARIIQRANHQFSEGLIEIDFGGLN